MKNYEELANENEVLKAEKEELLLQLEIVQSDLEIMTAVRDELLLHVINM
jgi:cell shape-determining protein MreC